MKSHNKKILPSKIFKISVEGENCEILYFQRLKDLINACPERKFNAKITVKQKNPYSFAKTQIGPFSDIRFYHIQDIEDPCNAFQLEKFTKMIGDIEKAKKECNIKSYVLGYTNFAFELWVLLHRKNVPSLINRTKYLSHINSTFGNEINKTFYNLDEYKKYDFFEKIVNCISLDDVKKAIERGDQIINSHIANLHRKKYIIKFGYYEENPDLTIHDVVRQILNECGIDC